MERKYRIVTDRFLGYEAQWSFWWYPFWIQCGMTNTSTSIEKAKLVIAEHKKRKVWSGAKVVYKEK